MLKGEWVKRPNRRKGQQIGGNSECAYGRRVRETERERERENETPKAHL